MSRPWHPSMGPQDAPRLCRVCCDDGTIMCDDLTLDEATAISQEFDLDTDSHAQCIAHVVEMYAGWVPISTSRAVA